MTDLDAPELARHRAQSSLHQARDLASISLVEPQLDAYGYGYGGREEEDMGGMGPLDFGDEYGFEVGDAVASIPLFCLCTSDRALDFIPIGYPCRSLAGS